MRFQDFDPQFAIVKLADGQPIKLKASDAGRLPDGAYEFNAVLFDLLCTAFENEDRKALEHLWSVAHRFARASA